MFTSFEDFGVMIAIQVARTQDTSSVFRVGASTQAVRAEALCQRAELHVRRGQWQENDNMMS